MGWSSVQVVAVLLKVNLFVRIVPHDLDHLLEFVAAVGSVDFLCRRERRTFCSRVAPTGLGDRHGAMCCESRMHRTGDADSELPSVTLCAYSMTHDGDRGTG